MIVDLRRLTKKSWASETPYWAESLVLNLMASVPSQELKGWVGRTSPCIRWHSSSEHHACPY